MSTSVAPAVLWAQRSSLADEDSQLYNKLIISVEVPKVDSGKFDLKVTDTSISFQATASTGVKYEFSLDFFADVVGTEAQASHSGDVIRVLIPKKAKDEEYWPRLTKEKVKLHYLRTDFSMWADEDEQREEDAPGGNFGDMNNAMDFSQMAAGGAGGMPGMPGMGGMPGMDGMDGMGGFDMSSLSKMAGLDGMEGLGDLGGLGDAGDEVKDLDDDEKEPAELDSKTVPAAAEGAKSSGITEIVDDKPSS